MQSARHGLTGMFFMVVTFREGIIIDDVISWHKMIILLYLTFVTGSGWPNDPAVRGGYAAPVVFSLQHVNAGGAHVVPSLVMSGV